MEHTEVPETYLSAPGVAQAQRNTALDYALQFHRTYTAEDDAAVIATAGTFLAFLRGDR